MAPKRKERDAETTKNPRLDHIQADHELFLQAFEKPTQIYRYLRTRNFVSPIFLNRTLLYMKHRMSRSHKSRLTFKVDSMLEQLVEKNKKDLTCGLSLGGYMTLTFLGFYDSTLNTQIDSVNVETFLLKISHKKRKDSAAAVTQNSIGTSEVFLNPSEGKPPSKAAALSIPSESFKLGGGPLTKSYMLLLRVDYPVDSCDEIGEPMAKKSKSSKLYGTELIVYDKHSRCLLSEGDYELRFHEIPVNSKKQSSSAWENIDLLDLSLFEKSRPFEIFHYGPTLKFKLCWTQEPSSPLVERPPPFTKSMENVDDANKENRNYNNNQSTFSIMDRDKVIKRDGRTQIVYQFLYNNNSRQQTEACADYHCPWCSLNCGVLYSLLKHLKLSHSRFTFTYVPITQGARIDVAINELYDGSYVGAPHDLVAPSGFAFSRSGPVRRTTVTHILVCRPRRCKPSLSEFLELDENEFDSQRPYITGHNRLYHHTITCLPVQPKELDADSEGESDPLWLRQKTMMMIDEFTDVNEGEKELMKMWNLHVMKYGYVGDCQIPLACAMFIQMCGKELLEKNLYKNFILHMCSLYDFGLISPENLYQTIQRLQDLIKDSGDIQKSLQESRDRQMEYWLTYGIHKEPPKQDNKTNVASGSNGKSNLDSPMTRRKIKTPSHSGRSGFLSEGPGSQRRKLPTQMMTNGSDTPLRRKMPIGGLLAQKRRSEVTLRNSQSEAVQRKRMCLAPKLDTKN